jgi:sodium pump decarboxylase gamma subunit
MVLLSINWSNALIVTILGIGLVFFVLLLLICLLLIFGIVAKKFNKSEEPMSISQDETYQSVISENESAAIAMALHLYYDDIHDDESYVITIKNTDNRYSPWSSKIYGINNY